MKSVNWRNSDCQFSITAPPKPEREDVVDHHETGVPPCAISSALCARWPTNDWPASESQEERQEEDREAVLAEEAPHPREADSPEEHQAADDHEPVERVHRPHGTEDPRAGLVETRPARGNEIT